MSTGFVYHPACLEHDAGQAHPERPERLRAVHDRLQASGVRDELEALLPPPATPEALRLVHDPEHLSRLEARCGSIEPGHHVRLDADTVAGQGSWKAALLAAGGALEAARRVNEGTWRNAFVAVRPPGHHAERARAMGFCLLNNVAVAAASLRRAGVERVAIVDFDVHHGNGTQHAFEADGSVFYASLHQWPLYPGTGAADERGIGPGEGATLNCPLEAGSGDEEWLDALETSVLPALEAFAPGFLLLSAGFDAHRRDPLGGCRLSKRGFRLITRRLLELAARHCSGRVVSVLEGGYDLRALAASVEVHVEELAGAAR